jgi:hypothetical protein
MQDIVGRKEEIKVFENLKESRNLCEMRFSVNSFVIDKAYADSLRQKIRVFKAE